MIFKIRGEFFIFFRIRGDFSSRAAKAFTKMIQGRSDFKMIYDV